MLERAPKPSILCLFWFLSAIMATWLCVSWETDDLCRCHQVWWNSLQTTLTSSWHRTMMKPPHVRYPLKMLNTKRGLPQLIFWRTLNFKMIRKGVFVWLLYQLKLKLKYQPPTKNWAMVYTLSLSRIPDVNAGGLVVLRCIYQEISHTAS